MNLIESGWTFRLVHWRNLHVALLRFCRLFFASILRLNVTSQHPVQNEQMMSEKKVFGLGRINVGSLTTLINQ